VAPSMNLRMFRPTASTWSRRVAAASLAAAVLAGCSQNNPSPTNDTKAPPSGDRPAGSVATAVPSGTALPPADFRCSPSVPPADAPPNSCTCKAGDTTSSPDWHTQGAELQGTGITGCATSKRAVVRELLLAGMTKNGQPVSGAKVENGRLTGTYCGAALPPAEWAGVIVQGTIACVNGPTTPAVSARIVAAVPNPSPGVEDTYLYAVELKSPDTNAWIPACAEGAPAIAMAGYWNNSGARQSSSDKFTFACTNAALGKCYDWGYVPWKDESRAKLHAACTRMAMADYPSNGTAYTENGTLVNVWDSAGIQMKGPASASPGATFEAAWNAAGLVCIAHARVSTKSVPAGFCNVPKCDSDGALPPAAAGPFVFNSSLPHSPPFCP
jgi:hypothetical protein